MTVFSGVMPGICNAVRKSVVRPSSRSVAELDDSEGGGPPPSGSSILLESGDALLLESGDRIQLEG